MAFHRLLVQLSQKLDAHEALKKTEFQKLYLRFYYDIKKLMTSPVARIKKTWELPKFLNANGTKYLNIFYYKNGNSNFLYQKRSF